MGEEGRRAGFTILEVMLAVFVLTITIGGLLEMVRDHLKHLANARRDLTASVEAEHRVRELQLAARDGILPDVGRTDGIVDDHDYLHWELIVEEASLPRPADDVEGPPSSSLFAEPRALRRRARRRADPDVPEPSLLRVTVRVFQEGTEDPEKIPPYVAYIVRPPDDSLLERLAGRTEGAPIGAPR